MKKILIILAIILMATPSFAQWRKIADFIGKDGSLFVGGELITSIYFIDLPGPPRIGFVGSESELHKTTDGGKTWKSVWGNGGSFARYYITDICFKDSLTGWFSIFNDYGTTGDACYRTTDGGESWTLLPVSGAIMGASAICYSPFTNRLFLSLAGAKTELSSDLGNTWNVATNVETSGMSFSTDSIGIAQGYPTDSTWGLIRTTDGGLTWSIVDTSILCEEPLAIPGTPICFEADRGRIIIRRSDDYGLTWRVIKDFGPFQDSNFNLIAPLDIGVMRGNLPLLYIQTDSGMFISTDQGVTWVNNGGPARYGDVGEETEKFYSSKGITMAGMSYANGSIEDGGLWEEDWPQAGVAEQQDSIISYASSAPNPTGEGAVITFGINQEAYVKINLFNVLGEAVSGGRVPGSGGEEFEGLFQPGNHAVPLSLQGLPSGTYYARILTAYGSVATVKLVKE